MAAFKSPDFNERSAAARAAKQIALEQLRNKPAPDPALVAQRQAARLAREAAAAERQAARKLAASEAKAAKAVVETPAPDPVDVPAPARERQPKNEAELKAVRDARYAARRARKR